MKNILIGLMMLLTVSLVGCSSNESTTTTVDEAKELVLTETEASEIMEAKKATEDEYKAIIKYFVDKMLEATEEYDERIDSNESKEDIFTAITYYRDTLMDIEDDIFRIHFARIDTKVDEDIQNNYDMLVDLKNFYMNSLNSQIYYIRNEDETELDKSAEELNKASEKYEEIMNNL